MRPSAVLTNLTSVAVTGLVGGLVSSTAVAVSMARRARERPDLARKYGIAVVPTVLAVASDGTVLERLAP